MAQATVCDGCHRLVSEAHSRGRLRVREYCAICAARVDAFAAAESELIVAAARLYQEGLASLRADLEAKCPALKLPL